MGRSSDCIDVASVADAGYTVPLAAMLQSGLANLEPSRTLRVHLFDMGIAPGDRERLESIADRYGSTLVWHDAGSLMIERFPLTRRMTNATYARLALPRLLPDVKKVVWLDADVIVTADLGGLWTADLGTHHLLAVRDPCIPYVSSRYGVRRWRELGLSPRAKYFNAGVMLLHLDRWRADEIGELAADYVRRYPGDCMFWDQDGLNAALCDRWGELDHRWNYCPAFTPRARPETAGLEPWIIHFAGTLKPWLLPEPEVGARRLFYHLLDDTPWSGWRPRRTVASVAGGWYESSPLRDLLYPAEHWWMLFVRRRAERVATRLRAWSNA